MIADAPRVRYRTTHRAPERDTPGLGVADVP
jgi:hypothetical protein